MGLLADVSDGLASEWEGQKHSSREALQKSTAQRTCLRKRRDDTISALKKCTHIPGNLPASEENNLVGADW